MFGEQGRQLFRPAFVAPEHQHSGGVVVEAVDRHRGLLITKVEFVEMIFDRLGAARSGMDRHPGGFIHRQDHRVPIQNPPEP